MDRIRTVPVPASERAPDSPIAAGDGVRAAAPSEAAAAVDAGAGPGGELEAEGVVESEAEGEGEGEVEAAAEEEGGRPGEALVARSEPRRLALRDGWRRGHLGIKAFDERGRPAVIEHRFEVEAECEGWRLDRFLMKRIRRLSRARVQRVIRGDLDIDGAPANRPGQAVHAGQVVAFRRPAPQEPDAPRDIVVVLAEPAFYALAKPAGLPIHPTARYHYSTLTAVLRERFPDEALEVCHRLDRETSGLLLVARTREAGPLIKRAFARRQVEKRYLAIVHGELCEERCVDLPLGLAGGRVRVRMGVRPVAEGGLSARTVFVPLRGYRGYTLVEARPSTGRQHQIRVHASAIGHPVVGDKLYPDEERFLEWADHGDSPGLLAALQLPRHALHASALRFPHPFEPRTVELDCPLPPDLEQFLSGLRPRDLTWG